MTPVTARVILAAVSVLVPKNAEDGWARRRSPR